MNLVDVNPFDELVVLINNLSDEKSKRILLSKAAEVYGYGGKAHIVTLTGTTYPTLKAGKADSVNDEVVYSNRIRKEGGGRKPITEIFPGITDIIEQIIDGNTYGDPCKELHWVASTLSLRKISDILVEEHSISISHVKVSQLLSEMGYSKQVNQKMEQVGVPSPYRNEQFEFIDRTAHEYLENGDPVISVDTKKKENIGNFKNNGAEYRKEKDPRRVLDHDFPIPELGKVAPYGVYVLNDNTGFINLGISHDTSEFAVSSISYWWEAVGKVNFPDAKRLYITCDGGGSNGSRSRNWKYELQQFSNDTGLELLVSHYPPGTSKWNKIEHRMFCYISKNWQGQPLVDIETVISLISNTTTKKGLSITCQLDEKIYETGRKITDKELSSLNIIPCEKLGKWNYIVRPQL
ncbi:MAG: ISAzo13 family transposase [Bacteroidales bacterium]|jgi:hypothetical protein|nr:ISAzo13 family transposase [Bacteroidales bacterium]